MKKEQIESYAKVTRQALTNPELSSDALRLLILMTNNAEGWKINTTYYQRLLAWHPSKLSQKTAELIRLGYLTKTKTIIPGTNKFDYKYLFPTTFTFTNIVNTNVLNTNFVKPKLNKNKLDTAPSILNNTPSLKERNKKPSSPKLSKLEEVRLLMQIHSIPSIIEEEKKPSESCVEDMVSIKQIERFDQQESYIYTEDMIEPIESVIKGIPAIQIDSEVTNPIIEEVIPYQPKQANNSIKHLDGRFDFNKEEIDQLKQYTLDVFKSRSDEFLSTEDLKETITKYLNNLVILDFQPGGLPVSSWRGYISKSAIQEIERYKVEKEKQFKALQLKQKQLEMALKQAKEFDDRQSRVKAEVIQRQPTVVEAREIDHSKIYDPINQPGTRYCAKY